MGRMYAVTNVPTAVTTIVDIVSFEAPAAAAVKIHAVHIFQNTDVKDAEEEILSLVFRRITGTVTAGSGGATAAGLPLDLGDTADTITIRESDTTIATGTATLIAHYGWNVRVPFDLIYTPETMPFIRPTDAWTITLDDAPADSLTIAYTVIYEEIS